MHTLFTAIILLPLVSFAVADAISDFTAIGNLFTTTSDAIASSLTVPVISNVNNGTSTSSLPVGSPYDTATALQSLISALNASAKSYTADQSAFVNGASASALQTGYDSYINEVPTLAQALTARGRAWHSELNAPVHDLIQTLSQAVYTYGSGLATEKLISGSSTISTITASSSVVNSETAWSMPSWLPGP